MKVIADQTYELERSLYRLEGTELDHCTFAGPADGESPLKHPREIRIKNCNFSLRYPIWHAENFEIIRSSFDEKARAALWYCYNGLIVGSTLHGIKALRDCENVLIKDSDIISPEFGWKCRGVKLENSTVEAEYVFLDTVDLYLKKVRQKGKYSFQYCRDLLIEDSFLDTKDAFWHSENVTVRNSHVKGEYLAWYSSNLTLENCVIEGTQPLCFCKGLRLINCEMKGCDLAFEASEVEAEIDSVQSIKNPAKGTIKVHCCDEIISDEMGKSAKIIQLEK